MNKKTYLAPQMNEVHMVASFQICEPTEPTGGKKINKIDSNADVSYGGAGTGSARSNDRRDDSEWGNLW